MLHGQSATRNHLSVETYCYYGSTIVQEAQRLTGVWTAKERK